VTARKGFTLIELLVVIAVIGILAAIALISLTGLQRSARDSQRKSNISDYATALARFYQDQQSYPVSAAGGDNSTTPSGIFSGASVLVSGTYMPKVLMDPLPGAQGATNCKLSNAGAGQQCQYKYYGNTTNYTIFAVLESPDPNKGGVFYINDRGTRGLGTIACVQPVDNNCL